MASRRNNAEHAYIVTYDIGDSKRWRRVFKAMHSYGHWLQLSVFHCRLDGGRRIELAATLSGLIGEGDHVLILDLGPAEDVAVAVESLGQSFVPIERRAVVI